MKPIVGEFNYPDMSPEEINRYMREAEKMRAVACREMFVAAGRAMSGAVKSVQHFVEVHLLHKAAGAR